MKRSFHCTCFCLFAAALLFSCKASKTPTQPDNKFPTEYQAIFDTVQRATFNYFWDGAEPNSGMARERIHLDGVYPQNDQNVVTIGGGGFGVMAILVGIERNYITRKEGFERIQKIVGFLETADRYHGAWPHWLNGETGRVKPFSKKR